MNIDLIPDIHKYPHLYDSHKNGRLVVFIGAGVSALWGCLRWEDMAASLVTACYDHGFIDYWAKRNLLIKYSYSPRKLITITKNILGDKYLADIQKTLQIAEDRKRKLPDIFKNLFALNAVFMTTNIDSHFDSLFDKHKIHFDPAKFFLSNFKLKSLFHLHGVVDEPISLVLTIDEYLKRYQNPDFTRFLENIFFDEKLSLLFLGYGVDEMEIIDYMIEKYSDGNKSLKSFINRFYILLPLFRSEESLLEYEQLYFNKINMTVVPYAIDDLGYDQLYCVVEKWKEELADRNKAGAFYRFSQIIDRNT